MRIIPHFSAEGLSNVYIISDNKRNGILVDPAQVDKDTLDMIESYCDNLVAVLITHKHQSHTAGLGTLLKIYNPTIYAFESNINGYRTEQFKDGEVKRIGAVDVKALHIPGHSIDSLVYLIESALFTGDTLLSGSIATCGSFVERALLIRSIEMKLMCLDDSTLLYPGQGAPSILRIEKMLNQALLQFESENRAFTSP